MVAQIKQFAGDVQAEMKKVSWPTTEQLKESTIVVVVMSIVVSLIVALMDLGVSKLLDLAF